MTVPSSPGSGSDPGLPRRPGETAAPSDPNVPHSPRAVTPWDETVKYSPHATPRPASEPAVPDEAAQAPPTARFGKFVRTRKLGAGGMGEVWKAWDTALARWVALKFLKGGDEEEIARFRREAQMAGRLHHPNIAAIFEVNEDQGRHYIAMQYVEGQTLRSFRPPDRRVLVSILAEAARAVHYAHEQGVVHRDLKPENLMVALRGTEPHVYVMDFGLARAAEGASNLTVSGFVVGTPAYMPPEQARGERVDARADVYSLGATLYELLTGVRVFDGPNVYELLKRVQEDDPRPPRKIDVRIHPDLETIVMKCLAKDANARYASALELAEDLSAFNAGEAIRARPEGLSRKLWRRVRRNPAVTLAAMTILVGGSLVGTWATGASRNARVADLTQRIDGCLRPAEWTEAHLAAAERLILELEGIAPSVAGGSRQRLKAALAASIRDSIRAGELERVRAALDLMESRDRAEAARLREEVRQRESIWSAVFKVEPPFGNLASVFEKGRVRVEGGLLRREAAPADLVATRQACRGNVEFKAEFDPAWRTGSSVGLVLNSTREAGYQFLLMAAEPREPGAALPSFEEIHAARGGLRLQIRRRDVVLKEQAVAASKVFGDRPGDAPLRLMARRELDRLTFQVNDLPSVEYRDPFAVGVATRGVFAVRWPAGAGLLRLQANRRDLPEVPSPLQLGDELFVQASYEQALERYREAALGARTAEVRHEARYKEALCHQACNREDSAIPIFEEVGAQFLGVEPGKETTWTFLADCQLVLYYFRRKDGIDRARQFLEKLAAYKYEFRQVAVLLPQEVQRTLLDTSVAGGIAGNLHLKPEELVARLEFGAMASEILEGPAPQRAYKRQGLLRAYWTAGREADALKVAEKSFAVIGYPGEILDDYCWILRLQGDSKRAHEAIARGVAADPAHLVERARIYAAQGEWDWAERDLEEFFKKPSRYFHHSAACLLQGFLLERRGEPREKVEAVWKKGLAKNWKPLPGSSTGPDAYEPGADLVGTPLLNTWIMASLTQDLTDAEGAKLLSWLIQFAEKDSPIFNRLMRPSVLRATFASPRGRELARRLALRDVPWADFARFPIYLGWVAFIHEICFPPGPLSADQDEVLWRLAQDIHAAYVSGRINEKYLLPFGMIAQGTPNYAGMGWKELSALLEPAPRLRGPIAYVFGQRYVKKGDATNAAVFYECAVKDADRDPADPRLKKLAQAELERIRPR